MRRLDRALMALYAGLSRRKAQDAIAKGQVTAAGTTVWEPGLAVKDQTVIVWNPNRKVERRPRIDLPVLHEDEYLVVVDKPAGLLSVPTTAADKREDTAWRRVQEGLGRGGRRAYAGVVHRLDRGTSGALVFAKDPVVRAALRSLFRAHRIERRYLALVAGTPRAEEGIVDAPIRDAYVSGRRAVAKPGEPSRQARTSWRVLERLGRYSLLEVAPRTGRQHQIRIHLAHLGVPVAGDAVYGRRTATTVDLRLGRLLLHAHVIEFAHPVTGRLLRGTSPLPADFATLLRRLRRTGAPHP